MLYEPLTVIMIIADLREQFNSEYVEIIHFRADGGNSSDFMEHNMPYPLTIEHYDNGYCISWALDGYSGTRTGKEYKFDTIDKIARALNAEVLPYQPRKNSPHYHPHINRYNDFKGIHLPKERVKPKPDIIKPSGQQDDKLFDYCRYDIYALKARGLLYQDRVFEILEEANQRLGFNKSYSYIRSKARNMFEWTEEKYCPGLSEDNKTRKQINADYYQKHKKESSMTREEASKVANQAKITKVKAKIEMAIESLKFQGEKLNKSKVAKMTKISRNTVAKYWVEFA